MKKTIWLVTVGNYGTGYNPGLTADGREKILSLTPAVALLKPTRVLVGTGTRFQETFMLLEVAMRGAPLGFSPFCGGPECLQENGQVAVYDGLAVEAEDFKGLVDRPGFYAREFLVHLPNKTLVVTGNELVTALAMRRWFRPGVLLEVTFDYEMLGTVMNDVVVRTLAT
jgi:hypothetical protein